MPSKRTYACLVWGAITFVWGVITVITFVCAAFEVASGIKDEEVGKWTLARTISSMGFAIFCATFVMQKILKSTDLQELKNDVKEVQRQIKDLKNKANISEYSQSQGETNMDLLSRSFNSLNPESPHIEEINENSPLSTFRPANKFEDTETLNTRIEGVTSVLQPLPALGLLGPSSYFGQ